MSNKHKHYDMIVAKAASMDLTVFNNGPHGKSWHVAIESSVLSFCDEFDYFLCLPQHEEACLHWLNGGDIEMRSLSGGDWQKLMKAEMWGWDKRNNTMSNEWEFRIKPKKEKRWIGVYKNGATTDTCLLENEAKHHPMVTEDNFSDWQFIEIEVEISI